MQGNLAARFALAMVAEAVYLLGRNWLLEHTDPGIMQEFCWSAWRVPFVALYLVLVRPFLFTEDKVRGMPWHPLLLLAFGLCLVEIPWGPVRGDMEYRVVLAATTPIVGVREELFYRGILQGFLERFVSPVHAIVLSAVVFTAYHYGAQPMNVVTCTGIAAFGVTLGAIYQRTRNLWLVAALHALIDTLYAFSPQLDIAWVLVFLCNVWAIIWAIAWWRVDVEKSR